MRKLLTGVLAAVCLTALVPAARAESLPPTIRMSWDNCDPTVFNKDFVAGSTTNKIVVSGIGFQGTYQGGELAIHFISYDYLTTEIADAWQFQAGGCQDGQLTSSTAGLTKACPKIEGLRPLPLFQYDLSHSSGIQNSGYLQWFTAYDPFVAAAATRYTVVTFNFDMTFADVGPQDPAVACGNADKPVCIIMKRYGYLDENNIVQEVTGGNGGFDNKVITWQDAANPGGRCPATPVKPATWGSIKATYHQ